MTRRKNATLTPTPPKLALTRDKNGKSMESPRNKKPVSVAVQAAALVKAHAATKSWSGGDNLASNCVDTPSWEQNNTVQSNQPLGEKWDHLTGP
jgi:hypothetical protein